MSSTKNSHDRNSQRKKSCTHFTHMGMKQSDIKTINKIPPLGPAEQVSQFWGPESDLILCLKSQLLIGWHHQWSFH